MVQNVTGRERTAWHKGKCPRRRIIFDEIHFFQLTLTRWTPFGPHFGLTLATCQGQVYDKSGA